MESEVGRALGVDPEPHRPSWILPVRPPGGLPALAAIVRDRWWLALLVAVVVAAAGIAAWDLQAASYRAESLLIVSPSSAPAISECGLDVINGGGGLTRDVETLARLVRTPNVAVRARAILKSSATPEALLQEIASVPVGQSYLVSISATASTPDEAAAVSNAFAKATVSGRSERFNREVLACRKRLEANAAQASTASVQASLVARVAQLRALEGGGDPTVAVDTLALPPSQSTAPSLLLVLLAALAAGVALGLGSVVLAASLDRHIRSERQLTEAYSLPVLGRVPTRHGKAPVVAAQSSQLAPDSAEAYRAVRRRVLAASSRSPLTRSVLFTSATRREGRTASAINTAVALAEAGQSVLLVDLDLRHPQMARLLGVSSELGFHDVLERSVPLANAVNSVVVHGGTLDVLLALPRYDDLIDQVSPAAVREIIDRAQQLKYDTVVFDAPELGSVSDALSVATEVDDVFLVVWRKRTPKAALAALARLCADHGIAPRGFLILGAKSATDHERGVT